MSALLAPSYWVMRQAGIDFAKRPDLAMYLLTMIGVTIPVAGAAGLMYRMGRLFELRRPWRATLALVAVLASGLVSYATVLNPHAPAAALVLCAAACLIHVSITNKRVARLRLAHPVGALCRPGRDDRPAGHRVRGAAAGGDLRAPLDARAALWRAGGLPRSARRCRFCCTRH